MFHIFPSSRLATLSIKKTTSIINNKHVSLKGVWVKFMQINWDSWIKLFEFSTIFKTKNNAELSDQTRNMNRVNFQCLEKDLQMT